jgi:hypothetical protein
MAANTCKEETKMAVTNYMSVNGQILSETTNGETTLYGTDALGNVVNTANHKCEVLNTYVYKPYSGEVWVKTGSSPDPKFLWVGSHGYRQTGLHYKFLSAYVRSRHYQGPTASWTSVDSLWPSEMPYGYVDGRVMAGVDPSGMQMASFLNYIATGGLAGELQNYFSKKFKDCGVSKENARVLATVFRCIAQAESGTNPNANAKGVNGTAFGLFQLSTTHFDGYWGCAPAECKGKINDWKCNAEAAFRLFITYCNDAKTQAGGNLSVFGATAAYWGVCRLEGGNRQLFDCLDGAGVSRSDVSKVPCPKKSKKCPGCNTKGVAFSGFLDRPWNWPKDRG